MQANIEQDQLANQRKKEFITYFLDNLETANYTPEVMIQLSSFLEQYPITDEQRARGYPNVLFELGKLASQRECFWILTKNLYERAASKGLPIAILTLGNIYLNGIIVEKDLEKAKNWFEQGAQLNDSGCLNALGFIYQTGIGVSPDPIEAIKLFRQAYLASKDNSKAKWNAEVNLKKLQALSNGNTVEDILIQYHYTMAVEPEKIMTLLKNSPKEISECIFKDNRLTDREKHDLLSNGPDTYYRGLIVDYFTNRMISIESDSNSRRLEFFANTGTKEAQSPQMGCVNQSVTSSTENDTKWVYDVKFEWKWVEDNIKKADKDINEAEEYRKQVEGYIKCAEEKEKENREIISAIYKEYKMILTEDPIHFFNPSYFPQNPSLDNIITHAFSGGIRTMRALQQLHYINTQGELEVSAPPAFKKAFKEYAEKNTDSQEKSGWFFQCG